MPKLPNHSFHCEATTGDDIDFESVVNVDGSGLFSFTIPDELERPILEFHQGTKAANRGVHVVRSHQKARITSRTHADCVGFIMAALEDIVKCEVTEEDVLVYRYFCGVHYWKTDEGHILPNGYATPDNGGQSSGQWADTNARSSNTGKQPDQYTIGFAAFAMVKKTFTRKSNTKVIFERWAAKNHFDYSDIRARLNAFNHLAAPDHIREDSEYKVIPYSPRAAEFFFHTMISLCKLDNKMAEFFGNEANVMKAIKSGSKLLLQ